MLLAKRIMKDYLAFYAICVYDIEVLAILHATTLTSAIYVYLPYIVFIPSRVYYINYRCHCFVQHAPTRSFGAHNASPNTSGVPSRGHHACLHALDSLYYVHIGN